jgi:Holliday junction DNA helicase RuvA
MIAMLRGILFDKQPSSVILDVGGVGYEVFIPLSTYDRLPATGSECRLLISHVVREDD